MKKTKFTKEKLRDVLLVSCLALLLVFAVWKIFYTPSSASRFSAGTGKFVKYHTASKVSCIFLFISGCINWVKCGAYIR